MDRRQLLITLFALLLCASSPSTLETLAAQPLRLAKIEPESDPSRRRRDIPRKLLINESYRFYDIAGSSFGDLRRQMKQMGTRWNDGKTYAALTTWDIGYRFEVESEGGKYAICSVKTDLDVVYHLPRCASPGAGLIGQWERYMDSLKVHEFGHKDLAVQAAAEINETLSALSGFDTREGLEQEARRLASARLQQLREQQVVYDGETRHGVTQGAVLPN